MRSPGNNFDCHLKFSKLERTYTEQLVRSLPFLQSQPILLKLRESPVQAEQNKTNRACPREPLLTKRLTGFSNRIPELASESSQ